MKFYTLFILTLLLQACALTSSQEDRLNRSLSKYIESYNDNNSLFLVAASEPTCVAYYKELGDSAFVNHFKQKDTENRTYYSNPIFREMREGTKTLQRKYWVEIYTESYEISNHYCIFALSEDGGDNWFFINEKDYFNTSIKLKKRLFKK